MISVEKVHQKVHQSEKQGSAQALVSFIRHYSGKEGESC